MYRRADLSRNVVPVVAVTAVSTGVSAREFRPAGTRNEDDPAVRPLRHIGSLVAEFSSGRHRIRMFLPASSARKKEALEQSRIGAIDLDHTNVALIGTLRGSR